MRTTMHYVTSVDIDEIPALETPQPGYQLEPWRQPTSNGMIDTRDMHGQSEPVQVDMPDGTTIKDSPHGLIATRPDGQWSPVSAWPPPSEGAVKLNDTHWLKK